MSTKKTDVASAIIEAFNNYPHIGIVTEDGSLQFNLSFKDAFLLLENKAAKNSFEIRRNTADDAEKGKPKPAIYGNYLGNDVLRIALGKMNNPIKKSSDLNTAVDYHIPNFELFLNISRAQMENLELFKLYKIEFFKQYQKTGTGIEI